MVWINKLASPAVAAALFVTALAATSAIGQDRERRTRETALGDGTIAEALRPDDDIVEISWPIAEIAAYEKASLPIPELQSAVKTRPIIAATVIVSAVSSELARNNTWIHTRFVATVNEVIVTSRVVNDRDRIAANQEIEFWASGGEVEIGRTTVRAGLAVRYPVGRRYLVLLGERQRDTMWPVLNRGPLLIRDDRLLALAPVKSPLSGMMLSDVTYALRNDRRVLLPRDQSGEDPVFAEWIGRLRTAAEKGDLTVIRDACAPTMSVFFEGESRESVLKRHVKDGEPWRELRDALRMGVVREESYNREYYLAPYVAGDGPPAYQEVAITARGVNVRSAPEPNAPVIRSLTYDVVTEDQSSHSFRSDRFVSEDNPSGHDAWAKIITPDGASGFVYGRFVRGPMDMRFVFERVDGQWLITAFAAGD